jgi:hypothetical protein
MILFEEKICKPVVCMSGYWVYWNGSPIVDKKGKILVISKKEKLEYEELFNLELRKEDVSDAFLEYKEILVQNEMDVIHRDLLEKSRNCFTKVGHIFYVANRLGFSELKPLGMSIGFELMYYNTEIPEYVIEIAKEFANDDYYDFYKRLNEIIKKKDYLQMHNLFGDVEFCSFNNLDELDVLKKYFHRDNIESTIEALKENPIYLRAKIIVDKKLNN